MVGGDATVNSVSFQATPTAHVKAFRKNFATAFSSSNLSKLMPKINYTVDRMLDIVEAKRQTGPIDCQDLCSKLALDTIGEVGFDINLGAMDGSRPLHDYLSKAADICRTNFTNALHKKMCEWLPWTKAGKYFRSIIGCLNAEWDWLVCEIRSRSDPDAGEEPLWWFLRNQEHKESGKPLDDKSLRSEVAGIVMAAMETTGQQLAWILSLLASHPDVTNNLLKEMKEHGLHRLEKKEITFQDLGNLPYLAAIIKEGMRIAYVAGGSLLRVVPEDMDILGYRIPKGTLINYPGTRAFATEEEWGDPDNFRPERWMTGEDMSDKYFMGFSVGPRDCVGQRLATMEMKLGVVKTMQRYHLELEGDWKELLENAFDAVVTKATGGIWLRTTPRELKD